VFTNVVSLNATQLNTVDKLPANPLAPSSGHTSIMHSLQPTRLTYVSPPPKHPTPAIPGANASAVSVERDVVPPDTQAPLSAGAPLPLILPTPPVPPLLAPSATAPKVAPGTTSEGGTKVYPTGARPPSSHSDTATH